MFLQLSQDIYSLVVPPRRRSGCIVVYIEVIRIALNYGYRRGHSPSSTLTLLRTFGIWQNPPFVWTTAAKRSSKWGGVVFYLFFLVLLMELPAGWVGFSQAKRPTLCFWPRSASSSFDDTPSRKCTAHTEKKIWVTNIVDLASFKPNKKSEGILYP